MCLKILNFSKLFQQYRNVNVQVGTATYTGFLKAMESIKRDHFYISKPWLLCSGTPSSVRRLEASDCLDSVSEQQSTWVWLPSSQHFCEQHMLALDSVLCATTVRSKELSSPDIHFFNEVALLYHLLVSSIVDVHDWHKWDPTFCLVLILRERKDMKLVG